MPCSRTPSTPSKRRKTTPSLYEEAKGSLNAAAECVNFMYRDHERDLIKDFIECKLRDKVTGSLYISGAPGTGKTLTVTKVIDQLHDDYTFKDIIINCMGCRTPNEIYSKIVQANGGEVPKRANDSLDMVTNTIVTPRKKGSKFTVIVLDEIDELENKSRDVLHTLFEWPLAIGSKAIVIGIANTLDFTDRCLKRFAMLNLKGIECINYAPYTKDQVKGIIKSRLPCLPDGSVIVRDAALELVSRKMSTFTGDIRKALHVVRRAVELTESEYKALVTKGSTPLKELPGHNHVQPLDIIPVGPHMIHKVMNEVYGTQASTVSTDLPTQQQIALCCILLFSKFTTKKETELTKVHTCFGRICDLKSIGFDVQSYSEFLNMIQLMETKGLIQLRKGKEGKSKIEKDKVSLSINEDDVHRVMTDKSLLKSILADPSLIR